MKRMICGMLSATLMLALLVGIFAYARALGTDTVLQAAAR